MSRRGAEVTGKDVLLVATIVIGFALFILAGERAMTPEFWDWVNVAAARLVQSAAIKFLVIVVTCLWCLSMIALAWDKAEERYDAAEARREANRLEAEAAARSLRVQREIEEATKNDRGQSAA